MKEEGEEGIKGQKPVDINKNQEGKPICKCIIKKSKKCHQSLVFYVNVVFTF